MNELIISQKDNTIIMALMDTFDKLVEIKPYSLKHTGQVGWVFLGIVRKKVKGIQAYFVDFGQEKDGYLPFSEVEKPLSMGETVMVQVAKDSYQTKGAKLTTRISFSGEYTVFVTDSNKIHFSSKLPEDVWTKSTKKDLLELKKNTDIKNWGLIVRTNAYGCDSQQLMDEIKHFIERYEQLLYIQKYRPSKACIYEPKDQWLTYVQNMNKTELKHIFVDSKEIYERLQTYFSTVQLLDVIEITLVTKDLFLQYDIPKKIRKALARKVWLSSGASIIIDRTEAMYVIDVNSDKNVSKTKSSRNILKINCEAAKEISRQIRLRNMSGIIIIDFIDMDSQADKKELLEQIEGFLKEDRIRTHVHGMTRLGLMELTRKRVEPCLEDLLKENGFKLDTIGIL